MTMTEQEAQEKIAQWADRQAANQDLCGGCGQAIYRLAQSNTWACASLAADDPTDCWRGEPESEPVRYGHYPVQVPS